MSDIARHKRVPVKLLFSVLCDSLMNIYRLADIHNIFFIDKEVNAA